MKIYNPLATASSIGVATRYVLTIASTIITILGILNWLTPEQVAALSKQVPELVGAFSALVVAALPLYAIITKSSSDKAAEIAKKVDEKVPESAPVVIQTPAGMDNIFVSGRGT